MHNNQLICYVCHEEIRQIEKATYIGKDLVTQKPIYRHRKCSPLGLPASKERQSWSINPKTKVKESSKIYNRNKEKRKIKKELEDV